MSKKGDMTFEKVGTEPDSNEGFYKMRKNHYNDNLI